MKVFISWSGERSKAIGDIIRRWLPSVLQAVRPYFSPDDISKGSRWNSEIAKELEVSRIGLLILTPENQDAPWLLFEAGALAKNLDRSKVCPILFGGLEPTDVKGPLVQFQGARFDADDMKRLVKMMNAELSDSALMPDVLESVFDMWWPRLAEQVTGELATHETSAGEALRSERDILEEVLGLTRTLAREGRPARLELDHPAFDELMHGLIEIVRLLKERSLEGEASAALRHIIHPLEYLSRRAGGPRSSPRLRNYLMEIEDLVMRDARTKPSPETNSEAEKLGL